MTATEFSWGRESPADTVVLPLPGDRAGDSVLEGDGFAVPEVFLGPRGGGPLVTGVVSLGLHVAHEPIGLPGEPKHDVGDGPDVVVALARDVVDRARLEAGGYGGQRPAGVVDVGRSPVVIQVDGV